MAGNGDRTVDAGSRPQGADRNRPYGGPATHGNVEYKCSGIAGWALTKGATGDYPDRLIPALVARGLYEPLQEFRDSPVLDAEMILALRRHDPESMRLALPVPRSVRRLPARHLV